MSRDPKPPMLARASGIYSMRSWETSDSIQAPEDVHRSKTRSPSPASPEDVMKHVRVLVKEGQIGSARQLLQEAVRRFPDDSEIRSASRILAPAEATLSPFVQPTSAAESEWLDNPPDEARGKWVALVGRELVAMADSVDELMEAVKAKNLRHLPLVHHLAA